MALAFPDRIAKARGGGDFTMANGRAASLPPEHALARETFLAVAEIAGRAAQARILAACALTLDEVEQLAADRIETRDETLFDPASAALRRRRFRRLGAIRLAEQNLSVEPSLENARVLARGIAALGVERLSWTKAQTQLRDRVGFLRAAEGEEWPDLSDAALARGAEDWLAPFVIGRANLAAIAPSDLDAALASLLPYELLRRLDAEAPAFFETPAGSRIALDYAAPNGPLLSVRVQELYGLAKHPTLARGRAAVTLELLSPAHRPIQTTRDLPGFWAGSWSEVKKEMKGRYPRHSGPTTPPARRRRHVRGPGGKETVFSERAFPARLGPRLIIWAAINYNVGNSNTGSAIKGKGGGADRRPFPRRAFGSSAANVNPLPASAVPHLPSAIEAALCFAVYIFQAAVRVIVVVPDCLDPPVVAGERLGPSRNRENNAHRNRRDDRLHANLPHSYLLSSLVEPVPWLKATKLS